MTVPTPGSSYDGRVLLSDLVGLPVVTPDGRRLGEVADLTVRLGPPSPPVAGVLVRSSRSTSRLLPWAAVEGLDRRRLRVGPGADVPRVPPAGPSLEPDELLLARDVRDTQVVDLRGARLSRVSEVLLERTGTTLAVVAVDLGLPALLRRLGLRRLVGTRPGMLVDWHDLHLTSRRGHQLQLTTDSAAFRRLEGRPLAELLSRLSAHKATEVIRAADPARAAAALHHSHPRTGARLVHSLSPTERQRLISAAATGHARTIDELARRRPPGERRRLLRTAGWRMHRPPEA